MMYMIYIFQVNYWEIKLREVFNIEDRLLNVSTMNREYLSKLGIKKDLDIFHNGYSNSR